MVSELAAEPATRRNPEPRSRIHRPEGHLQGVEQNENVPHGGSTGCDQCPRCQCDTG